MQHHPMLFEEFAVEAVVATGVMDHLWQLGWRHFGAQFFRYSMNVHAGEWQHIVPVRIDLERFELSKSQRRGLRKNEDLVCEWLPASVDEELVQVFEAHKNRFHDNVPTSLHDFVSLMPGNFPCACELLRCRLGGTCVAASFCDVDELATSSVYGLFAPDHSIRSLGIFTLLKEIERAMEQGRRWHYLGYASHEAGIYDYKKRFAGLEGFDWASETWVRNPFDTGQLI
ncbi:GNAT family N-acetyltransferase [Phragmitibacter flavus]|uniref:GNAT family N-acetyltransferase n=1 Tax=Phragmitibacter flavus TaxID=2576071 RepID=A0A5R8KCK7_9BACT|nr:GNAT family N-acetyltransferase [Phragmitibacter flavus]TLD70038.1 GNAT family N-acetyltransferase [Phragmitibacter flavus]